MIKQSNSLETLAEKEMLPPLQQRVIIQLSEFQFSQLQPVAVSLRSTQDMTRLCESSSFGLHTIFESLQTHYQTTQISHFQNVHLRICSQEKD